MAGSDVTIEGFRELEAKLLSIADGAQADAIQRDALRAVVKIIQPVMVAATPVSAGKRGSTSLKPGELSAAVRGRIRLSRDGSAPEAIVDFGKLSHVANFVDVGHVNPTAQRGLKHTPGTGFVRRVEDETHDAAATAYVETLQSRVDEALKGQ